MLSFLYAAPVNTTDTTYRYYDLFIFIKMLFFPHNYEFVLKF